VHYFAFAFSICSVLPTTVITFSLLFAAVLTEIFAVLHAT